LDNMDCIRKVYSEEIWTKVGVPQRSILGPILFLIFINNIQDCVSNSELCLFADDTSLLFQAPNVLQLEISSFVDTNCLFQWFKAHGLVVNASKTQLISFSIRSCDSNVSQLFVDEEEIASTDSVNFLGLLLDDHLNFHNHINKVVNKLSSCLFALRKLSYIANSNVLLTLYYGCFYPHLKYALPIWGYENSRTKSVFRL